MGLLAGCFSSTIMVRRNLAKLRDLPLDGLSTNNFSDKLCISQPSSTCSFIYEVNTYSW